MYILEVETLPTIARYNSSRLLFEDLRLDPVREMIRHCFDLDLENTPSCIQHPARMRLLLHAGECSCRVRNGAG